MNFRDNQLHDHLSDYEESQARIERAENEEYKRECLKDELNELYLEVDELEELSKTWLPALDKIAKNEKRIEDINEQLD